MPLDIHRRPNYSGPLIKVPTSKPGVCIKMTREEAVALGLLSEEKKQEPVANKKRTPAGNKGK